MAASAKSRPACGDSRWAVASARNSAAGSPPATSADSSARHRLDLGGDRPLGQGHRLGRDAAAPCGGRARRPDRRPRPCAAADRAAAHRASAGRPSAGSDSRQLGPGLGRAKLVGEHRVGQGVGGQRPAVLDGADHLAGGVVEGPAAHRQIVRELAPLLDDAAVADRGSARRVAKRRRSAPLRRPCRDRCGSSLVCRRRHRQRLSTLKPSSKRASSSSVPSSS